LSSFVSKVWSGIAARDENLLDFTLCEFKRLRDQDKTTSANIFSPLIKALIYFIDDVTPAPQGFSQTFSTSQFVSPTGEVISNSIYTDSDGKTVINGDGHKSPVKEAKEREPIKILSRPDWDTSIA
jgi:hypothetical protein